MAKLFYSLPNLAIRYISDYPDLRKPGFNQMQTYSLKALEAFMYYVLHREQLTIEPYLPDMGHLPYFLLASTGLGKTVAAPIHSYLKHCEKVLANVRSYQPLFKNQVPRIWIIEPKISIAKDQTRFMNELFADFIKQRNNPYDVESPVLFGCQTSVDKVHIYAPIKFVTTGIFAIFARFGYLDPERDCVVIDEAHVTVESAEGVELAIAICRQMGIPIHYMSATVDTANLHETLGIHNIIDATKIQRKPKWMHNTGRRMEDCIVDLVRNTLINPNPFSEYFPQGNEGAAKEIRDSVFEKGRAKGFLIVVNSFAGEDSDANKIADLLHAAYGNKIHILLLAGEIVRSPKRKKAFDDQLARIEEAGELYVIISTSVSEMGVTFPTLDFVATMDSGYEQITIGDTILPEIVPLPVNSMLQRIGRVGRKRPGIGYITNEVDAYYSSLSDKELNSQLAYEPIRLPLRKGSLALVAQYSFREQWDDPVAGLAALNLPSGIHRIPERVNEFMKQRQRLLDLGIAVDNKLTPEGEKCERWLEGGVDLGYALEIQEALVDGRKEDVFFYLVAATLSDVTLSILSDKDAGISTEPFADRFNTQTGKPRHRKGVLVGKQEIELPPQSELVALYNIVTYFSNKYAKLFFDQQELHSFIKVSYENALKNDCALFGFDPKKMENLLKGFSGILRILCDTNRNRQCFKEMFGELRSLSLIDITFPALTEWDIQQLMMQVATLPGRTEITLSVLDNSFTWQEVDGGRSGVLYENATCLALNDGQVLTAKLVPLGGKGDRKAGDAWKIVHAQLANLSEDTEDEENYEGINTEKQVYNECDDENLS